MSGKGGDIVEQQYLNLCDLGELDADVLRLLCHFIIVYIGELKYFIF